MVESGSKIPAYCKPSANQETLVSTLHEWVIKFHFMCTVIHVGVCLLQQLSVSSKPIKRNKGSFCIGSSQGRRHLSMQELQKTVRWHLKQVFPGRLKKRYLIGEATKASSWTKWSNIHSSFPEEEVTNMRYEKIIMIFGFKISIVKTSLLFPLRNYLLKRGEWQTTETQMNIRRNL